MKYKTTAMKRSCELFGTGYMIRIMRIALYVGYDMQVFQDCQAVRRYSSMCCCSPSSRSRTVAVRSILPRVRVLAVALKYYRVLVYHNESGTTCFLAVALSDDGFNVLAPGQRVLVCFTKYNTTRILTGRYQPNIPGMIHA